MEEKDVYEHCRTPLVVLGCANERILRARVLAAFIYAKRNAIRTIIASGGKGDNKNQSEADKIEGHFKKLAGKQKFEIIKEDISTNTRENAEEVKKILEGNFIFLLTSNTHIDRAQGNFEEHGITVKSAIKAEEVLQARLSKYKVAPVYIKYFLLEKIGKFIPKGLREGIKKNIIRDV